MQYTGRVHRFGNNINTDIHISGKYKPSGTPFIELVNDIFLKLDPEFKKRIQPGDFIVAGEGFGTTSSREDAIAVLKHYGIRAVIAPSFGYLFFRNAINLGLYVIRCEIPPEIMTGDRITVDFSNGTIILPTENVKSFEPYPPIIVSIIENGGLLPNLKKTKGL
jgi:3-isopropylmalate/(R)-2-methylmalate dehydratase small subunit